MADPFTIRIFVPEGDPEGVRLIDRMNWTGLGLVFRRSDWSEVRRRTEMQRTGIYVLVGYRNEHDDLPTLYIGQADGVKGRIDSHHKDKDFWDWCAVFVSTSGGLNRAHATWLEYALVKRARETRRCLLDNGNVPQEPALTEAEKADTRGFMKEIMQILPLVGLRAFEFPKAVATPLASDPMTGRQSSGRKRDTIIVPAQEGRIRSDVSWRRLLVRDPHLGRHARQDQVHCRVPDAARFGHHTLRPRLPYRALWRGRQVQGCVFGERQAHWAHTVWGRPSWSHAESALHVVRTPTEGAKADRRSGQELMSDPTAFSRGSSSNAFRARARGQFHSTQSNTSDPLAPGRIGDRGGGHIFGESRGAHSVAHCDIRVFGSSRRRGFTGTSPAIRTRATSSPSSPVGS